MNETPGFTRISRDSTRANTSLEFKYLNLSANFACRLVVTANQALLPVVQSEPQHTRTGENIRFWCERTVGWDLKEASPSDQCCQIGQALPPNLETLVEARSSQCLGV